jgi:hypothetical protein
MKILTGLTLLFSFAMTSQLQAIETAPPLVEKLYNGNWPSEEEGRELRDELYYQRAIHTYMTMLPALNTIGMRDG